MSYLFYFNFYFEAYIVLGCCCFVLNVSERLVMSRVNAGSFYKGLLLVLKFFFFFVFNVYVIGVGANL